MVFQIEVQNAILWAPNFIFKVYHRNCYV